MAHSIPDEVKSILSDLQTRFNNEQVTQVALHAEGRIHFDVNGQPRIGWLHRVLPGGSTAIRNIVGTIVGFNDGNAPYYHPLSAISRNSPIGNQLAEATPGALLKNGIRLLDRTLYTHEPNDLQDIEIVSQEGAYPRIGSLNQYQQELAAAIRERNRLQSQEEEARQQHDLAGVASLQAKIGQMEEQIRRIQQRIDTFTTRARLRVRPMLDPEQNKAKRLNLLTGPVIIEGGPGTGKTTTLIHRVQYLLDSEHLRQDELCTLEWNAGDDALLANDDRHPPYRFYSPNDTLQFYLKEALLAERLQSSPTTVTTWLDHRRRLLRDLGLTGTNGRFQIAKDDKLLLTLSGQDICRIQQEFEKYVVANVHQLVNQWQKGLALGSFPWQQDPAALSLETQIQELLMHSTVAGLLSPLLTLRQQGLLVVQPIREAYTDARDEAVKVLLHAVTTDGSLFQRLVTLAESKADATEDSEENQDAEIFEEEENVLGSLQPSDRQLFLVRNLLRVFVRAYALSKALPDTTLKGRNLQVVDLLAKQLPSAGYPAVAASSRFLRLFGPLLSGPEALVLQRWPTIFNAFRREVLYGKEFSSAFVSRPEMASWSTEKNAKLHADEADLLLMGLLQLVRVFYAVLPRTFAESTHNYLERYREEMRPVVGVDEASDYSPLQLTVITLLSHPRYTCVTLCGDLMQRLGQQGLNSWEEYTTVFKQTARAKLNISYRQCRTLLRLAAKLYEGQMGEKPTYKVSGRLKMPFHLRPTYCRNGDASERFDWLVTLICDLQATLGKHIPNLAILVKNSAEASKLAQQLNDEDRIYDASMKAEACEGQRVGQADTIRIFPVGEIKGMEFDGVIFWDADQLEKEGNAHNLDRLMYVAISRASFYVAVTFEKHFPKSLNKVTHYFTTQTWSQQMLADVADDERLDITNPEQSS